MGGFIGFKTATAEELSDAVAVMDPFHVVRLAGDALDPCRAGSNRPRAGSVAARATPLYAARRTLHTGTDLLTDKRADRLRKLFATDVHVEVEATWGTYQRMVAAYREPDRTRGRPPDRRRRQRQRATLDASYRALSETQSTVFRALGLAPGTGRSVSAVAASASLEPTAVEDALRAAARLHLVRQSGPARFRWHDLIHEYAVQRLREEDTAENRQASLHRLLDHYLGSAVEAARVCGFYVPRPPLGPPGAIADALTFPDPAAAHAWFDGEWEDMAVVITRTAEAGPRRYAWLLVDALRDFLQHRRPSSDYTWGRRHGVAGSGARCRPRRSDRDARLAGPVQMARCGSAGLAARIHRSRAPRSRRPMACR
jgi:hypothetical protein